MFIRQDGSAPLIHEQTSHKRVEGYHMDARKFDFKAISTAHRLEGVVVNDTSIGARDQGSIPGQLKLDILPPPLHRFYVA